MAWKLGAGMADMSFVSGTYGSHPETGEEFHELLTAYYMGAIIVNKNGRRFVDESQSTTRPSGRVVLDQPDGLGFEIFDAKVRAKSHRGIPLKDIDTLEDIGHVFTGRHPGGAGRSSPASTRHGSPRRSPGTTPPSPAKAEDEVGPHQPVQRRRRAAARSTPPRSTPTRPRR